MKQNDEITKMLKVKTGSEPNNIKIAATRLSVFTYCPNGRQTRQQDLRGAARLTQTPAGAAAPMAALHIAELNDA